MISYKKIDIRNIFDLLIKMRLYFRQIATYLYSLEYHKYSLNLILLNGINTIKYNALSLDKYSL